MRENVTISYRGARYEIGRGQHFYGIWVAGAPQAQPLEWWPETPVGWSHAWARFTGIEVPGTIVAVAPPAPPPPPPPAPPVTVDAPDAPPATTDSSPVTVDAPPVTVDTQPVATEAAAVTVDAPPGSQDAESGALSEPAAPGVPDASDAADAPGLPAESAVLIGQPVTPVGHPVASALQPAIVSGPPAPRTGLGGPLAAGLIIAGVICGVAGLFPAYLGGGNLAQEPANLVPHAIYFAAWLGGATLIVLGGALRRFGALLAVGTSAVTFGLFFADVGSVIPSGGSSWGTGLVLGLVGWLVCAVGSVLALRLRQPGETAQGRPRGFGVAHVLTLVAALGSLGTAIAFAPAWDSYTLRAPNGASVYRTLGDAFSNPGLVITGDVFVMISVVVIVVVAATWRPVRQGAWLMAGAIIPMAAQGISALVQVGEPTSPAFFGIPPAYAAQAKLTITNGVTPAFLLYCGFVVVVMVTCGWILLSGRSAALDTPPAPSYPPGLMPGTAHGAIPAAPGGMAPGYLPGGFQPMTEQQQLGDGQRL